jgi:hypothetical protein
MLIGGQWESKYERQFVMIGQERVQSECTKT